MIALCCNLYWPAIKTYRWLSKNNLILGSLQGDELDRPVKPKGFEKAFSKTQAKKGIEEIVGSRKKRVGHSEIDKSFHVVNSREYAVRSKEKWKIDKVIEHRKKIASLYKKILLDLGIETPYEPGYAEHTYLKFPLLVKDRANFFKLAEKGKIEVGDWFLSPIHPITKNFELWHYRWGENPIAERISQHIVNLPNHTKINENYVDRVAEFLKTNRDNLYRCYEGIEGF